MSAAEQLRTRIARLTSEINHLECLAHLYGMQRYGTQIMVLEARRENLANRLAAEHSNRAQQGGNA